MKKIIISIVLVFIGLPAYCDNPLIDIINTFEADKRALESTYTIDESEEYYQRFSRFYIKSRERLKTVDFEELSRDAKVDYLLLENLINREDYFLQLEYDAFKEVAAVTDFGEDIYAFIRERRRGTRPDGKSLAKVFSDAEMAIDGKMKLLENKPFSDYLQAQKASGVVESLSRALEEAFNFYYSYDPEFTWWMEKPYQSLAAKLQAYSEFLEESYSAGIIKDDGSGIVGKPIGRDALNRSLRFEYIPYSPEELIAAAESQFEWCKNEMIKASQEMGFGKDWKAALEHVKNTYVPPGEQPETITELHQYSVDFIRERDLITLPDLADETWKMIMMTPERQKVNPFFTGGRAISISYPTQEMSHADKMMSMRGNNPNFSFPTVQHELLPGHNLQYFMTSRHKSYRQAFRNPFWGEGWSLYWEILLWNKDFAQTPEQRMGMLFWRIHRCARIIFSLKYHLEEMTPQEAIDMLVKEVGHEYANAEAEVRRSFATNYSPLYQLAYMTGGLQFYALRKELLSQGWTEKEFHDRVMRENNMPVEILRLLLSDKSVKKEYQTQWKFSTEFK